MIIIIISNFCQFLIVVEDDFPVIYASSAGNDDNKKHLVTLNDNNQPRYEKRNRKIDLPLSYYYSNNNGKSNNHEFNHDPFRIIVDDNNLVRNDKPMPVIWDDDGRRRLRQSPSKLDNIPTSHQYFNNEKNDERTSFLANFNNNDDVQNENHKGDNRSTIVMNSNYGSNQQQLTNVSKGKNNSYERRLKSPVIKIASDYGREIDLKNFDAGTYDRDKAYEYLFTMMNDGHDDRTRRPPIGRYFHFSIDLFCLKRKHSVDKQK